MRGSIQQRGSTSWRVKAYVGRDSSGRKRYVQRTVRGTRRDATRELSRLVVDVDEGRYVASPAMTLDELLDRWLAVKRAAVEPSTLASYEWVARAYVRPALGDRRVGALRWSDIDLDRAELAVRPSIVQLGPELREKDTKTHQSRRLALDEATVAVLRQHRRGQREQALTLGTALADEALLFASPEGRPWRPDVVTNRFGRLRARLGLGHVRLHDLRHFVASVLIDGGIPISTVSSRLGHSQMSTTLNLYTHALPATDQRAAAYLGDLLTRRASAPARAT